MKNSGYDQLNYLRTIAEEQNLTRAAKRLFISQPALTNYVNRLEEELGIRLFDRQAQPVTLTAAGRYYITEMEKIEYQREHMVSHMRLMNQASKSTLSIGIGRNRGAFWLPHVLPKVYERFPDAYINITEDRDEGMARQVVLDILDLAIIESFIYIDSLSYEKLPDELHNIVAAYDPQLYGAYGSLEDNSPSTPLDVPASLISEQRFICPSLRGGLNFYTQQLFTTFHIAPHEIVFTSNNVTAYQLAVMGSGLTYLSSEYANIVSIDKPPLFIMPGGRPMIRKIYAVYKKDRMSDLKEYFIQVLKERRKP